MALLIRTLLIWLLALAVPVQGAAAARMLACGPHHPERIGMADTALAQAGAAHLPAAAGAPAAHKQHGGGPCAPGERDAAVCAAEANPATPADSHTCSACAACCSVGAMAHTRLTLAAAGRMTTVFAVVVPAVDPFAAAGPERPPRGVLA